MGKYDKVVQGAIENLYGDERVRANLIDAEAKVVLSWGENWLTEQINSARDETQAKQIAQTELARVKKTAIAISALAKKPGAPKLNEAVVALQASLDADKPFTRDEVWYLLTRLTSAAWRMRAPK